MKVQIDIKYLTALENELEQLREERKDYEYKVEDFKGQVKSQTEVLLKYYFDILFTKLGLQQQRDNYGYSKSGFDSVDELMYNYKKGVKPEDVKLKTEIGIEIFGNVKNAFLRLVKETEDDIQNKYELRSVLKETLITLIEVVPHHFKGDEKINSIIRKAEETLKL